MSNMLCEVMDKEIEHYKRDILSEGRIRLFFPMSFLEGDEGELISYVDVEGYIKLTDVKTMDGTTAIDLIGMMADSIRDAMDNYIFPEEYLVNEDTIYVDKNMRRVKLIYRDSSERYFNRGHDPTERSGQMDTGELTLFSVKSMFSGAGAGIGKSVKEAPLGPGPVYSRVRALADILVDKVGKEAAGPVWEAARLFRAEGYGLAAALRDCAEIRRKIYMREESHEAL